MPTRLLYEKICTSATLAGLSADEERFFYRLMVQCDDFGRFHADPVILRNRCFQRMEDIKSTDVRAWRDRLEQAGLIRIYAVDQEEYLEILTWAAYQRQRASKPKYPDPPADDGTPPQVAAECGSRVVKTRRPEAGSREPEAGSREPETPTPQPPSPPAGKGERRRPRRNHERTNGALLHPPPDPPPKLEPGEEWIEPGHPEYSPLVGRFKRVRV